MNATPLIDVLLVLLVMLIFTLPVATHAVKLNLPHPPRERPVPLPTVMVHIDFDGRLSWNGEVLRDVDALTLRFREAASATSQPRVKVMPDKRVRYEHVARVLAAAQRSGVARLEVAGDG
jgi:biopolymer transport protein ExbD